MKEVNLHGHSHYDVRDVVESYVLMNDAPFRIIADKSEQVRVVLETVLKKHKLRYNTTVDNTSRTVSVGQ